MCSGICPPSKPTGVFFRAPVPLVPRPAVLPLEPSPRPTRVFAVLAPGAGRKWCSLSVMSVHLFHDDHVPDRLEHATDLGTVLLDDDVADALEPKRAEGVPLVLLAADRRPLLLDLEACHHWLTSARAFSSAAGATSSTGRPRRAATASGSSSERSASTVACTMLIWFDEPSDLLSTSWMPAHSSTARTGPPAITPVPGAAGRRSTTPAAFSPWTGCGIVPWTRGTLKKCFLASSTPLAIAEGTSLALPYPTPTMPSPSPTTTRAVKLKRRPPFTTLATRLIATTRSTYAVLSAWPPRRSSRPPRRSPPPRRWDPLIRTTSSFASLDQKARPPSRAPSARAATRPWYLLPARSKTTVPTPF